MAGELAQLLWTEKYRPRTLDEVVNQSDVVARLKVFVKEKNMPHLLFTGPPGVGKTTVALALVNDLYGEDYRRYVLEMNASVSRDTPILVRIYGSSSMLRFSDLDEIYFSRGRALGIGDAEYVKADDLEVLTIDRASGRIRWARVRWLIRHRADYIARIKLDVGGAVELTGNHSVMAIDPRGELVTKKASEIRVGDHLLTFTSTARARWVAAASSSNRSTASWELEEAIREGDLYGYQKYIGSSSPASLLISLPRSVKGASTGTKYGEGSLKPLSIGEGDGALLTSEQGWLSLLFRENNASRGKVDRDSEPLPLGPLAKFIEILRNGSRSRARKLISEFGGSGGVVPRRAYREILDDVEPSELSERGRRLYWRLLWLANSDLHVARVESIDVAEYHGYVYDVSVPSGEMFFAGEAPVLLHNSDERGIDVIRTKVKEFARSAVVGEIPFKVIILDEADNMTADAQQALRRLMEMYVSTTRFILMANYSSKIIEPIQSRCAVFRFGPLSREDVVGRLKMIAEKEGVKYDPDALDAIYDITEGDMRRAINILQAASALGKVTVSSVYKVVGLAHPKEIREMIQLALAGNFTEARERLRKIMVEYGLSGVDVIRQIHKEIFDPEVKIDEDLRVYIADYAGEINYRLIEGSDDEIQLNAFLARLVLLGKKLGSQKK